MSDTWFFNMSFLNKYLRKVDPDMEIVTFYVRSLYTSIPHEYRKL